MPTTNLKQTMKWLLISFIIGLVFIAVMVIPARAATYYISPAGNDSSGTGSSILPWATLSKAFSSMSGGDTLIIKDGTYTGNINSINTTYQIPPYGSSGAYTIVKAEHDGAAIFDGEYTRTMFNLGWNSGPKNAYWQFEGIIWCKAGTNQLPVGAWYAGYIKMLRCGAYDAGDGNTMVFGFGTGCDHILLEGCYAWGNGRYGFMFAQTTYSIMRSCVSRIDRMNDVDPVSNYSMYSSSACEVQNCIAIDSDQDAYYQNYDELDGGFQVPSTSADAWNINFTNCINLNSHLGVLNTDGNTYHISYNVIFKNCVFWACPKTGGASNMIRGLDNQLLNCTFGNIPQIDWACLNSYNGIGYANDTTLNNSIVYGITGKAGANQPYAINNVEFEDYGCYYGNTNNVTGGSLGAHSLTTTNPIWNASTNPTGALKYITRVESGSNLSGQGEGGGDIGANIRTLIGTPGTLWGDPGYNTDTGVSMWPFPNEALIQSKMKAYNVGGVSGSRGFCADGTTLTKYIWEYLGNPIPSDIYGDGTTTPAKTFYNGIWRGTL